MKLLKKALVVLMALALLCACGSSGESEPAQLAAPDVDQLAEDMFGSVELQDDLMLLDDEVVGNLYQYDAESIAEMAVYASSTMSTPEEIAVFVAADEDGREYIDEMIKLRLQNLQFTFEDYDPDGTEMPKIENAKVLTKGMYTALVVCADPAPAEEVFEKAFS